MEDLVFQILNFKMHHPIRNIQREQRILKSKHFQPSRETSSKYETLVEARHAHELKQRLGGELFFLLKAICLEVSFVSCAALPEKTPASLVTMLMQLAELQFLAIAIISFINRSSDLLLLGGTANIERADATYHRGGAADAISGRGERGKVAILGKTYGRIEMFGFP